MEQMEQIEQVKQPKKYKTSDAYIAYLDKCKDISLNFRHSLLDHGFTIKKLGRILNSNGIKISDASLYQRVQKGTFSVAFGEMCLDMMKKHNQAMPDDKTIPNIQND